MRVLIVDDEAPARMRLREHLLGLEAIDEILEADGGRTAVLIIGSQRPDLVFLDVQMPELDGIGVIREVGSDVMPLTIFVTAYDQHAIAAFDVNALDYLLKPYSDQRLDAAIRRATSRLAERERGQFAERVRTLIQRSDAAPGTLERLVVKSRGTVRLVPAEEIDWIEAAGVYVTLHVGNSRFLYRSSLNDLEHQLDRRRFLRVHRSGIINLDRVVQLETASHGEFDVLLRGGTRARVSRTYRRALEERLGHTL
jgi:two-component system, LytTR family, response regulator